jgi:hypothetical protein
MRLPHALQICHKCRCRRSVHFRTHNHPAMSTFSPPFISALVLPATTAVIFCLNSPTALRAQSDASQPVIVQGEEVGSSYGAPPGFSRSRFSNLTNAYVLPPGAFFFGEIYEGDAFRHGPPQHIFTQELEVGLPYRFGIAAETSLERFNGGGGAASVSIEARYALADWNKIPLNPTLFTEFKFGTGPIRKDELLGMHDFGGGGGEEEEEGGKPQRPDAVEVRLLLAQDFGERVEWAMNWFLEQEVALDRGREWGFAQSATTPILLPNERLKVGVEMQYRNFTTKDTRDEAENSFIIGPTIAWKPTSSTRIDVSPLFGCTDVSPRAQVFAVFSWLLGPPGAGEQGAEAPSSTRNR